MKVGTEGNFSAVFFFDWFINVLMNINNGLYFVYAYHYVFVFLAVSHFPCTHVMFVMLF